MNRVLVRSAIFVSLTVFSLSASAGIHGGGNPPPPGGSVAIAAKGVHGGGNPSPVGIVSALHDAIKMQGIHGGGNPSPRPQ